MEHNEWLSLENTISLKRKLEERIGDRKEMWSNGCITGETIDSTIQNNAEAIGYVGAFLDVLEFLTEIRDEEDKEDQSEGIQDSY